jgi:hypothetical protein
MEIKENLGLWAVKLYSAVVPAFHCNFPRFGGVIFITIRQPVNSKLFFSNTIIYLIKCCSPMLKELTRVPLMSDPAFFAAAKPPLTVAKKRVL